MINDSSDGNSMDSKGTFTPMILSSHGDGKSYIAEILRMQGHTVIEGPIHTDSEDDIRRSNESDDDLFSERGLAHFHDAVLYGCDKSLSDAQLRSLFERLPESIQADARQFGFSDTPVGDAICTWAKQNAVFGD